MNETVTDNEGNNFIPDLQLVNNNSQRLPCVLVLDGSYSMTETNDEISSGTSPIHWISQSSSRYNSIIERITDSKLLSMSLSLKRKNPSAYLTSSGREKVLPLSNAKTSSG